MKGVQCYELFGGIALNNHTFSFFSFSCHRENENDPIVVMGMLVAPNKSLPF